MKSFFVFLLCFLCSSFTILQAQEQPALQHHIGLEVSLGHSGLLHSPSTPPEGSGFLWDMSHYRAALGYHALLLEGHLHLGAGLGFQNKQYIEYLSYRDSNGELIYRNTTHMQRDLILPIEIGYQSQLGGKHNFTADVVLTPLFLLQRTYHTSNPLVHYPNTPANTTRIGLETGLKLGYLLHLSDKMSLQIGVLGTIEPFARDNQDRQHYTIGLNAGLRYQL